MIVGYILEITERVTGPVLGYVTQQIPFSHSLPLPSFPLVLWVLVFSLLISSTSSTALILISVKCSYYEMPSTSLPTVRREKSRYGDWSCEDSGSWKGFLQSLGGCFQGAKEEGTGFEG